MAFWTALFVSLVMTVVGELLRPKQKFDKPKPSGLGDFQFPTADASRVIPVFCGTVHLKGPNVVWFGDLKSAAITKKVKTGLFSSDRITLGHQYFIGVQLVFGWGGPDLKLIDFRIDDKSVIDNIPGGNLAETANGYGFVMNKPTLLGNDEPNNGVSGPVKFYKGTTTQPPNNYLASRWGDPNPTAFRRLCYAVLEQCYLGNSDTPPPVTAVVKLCPNGLNLADNKHDIGGDANPACWAYEIMTNKMWGLRMDPGVIDIPSFVACAEKLYAEGMGVSMIVESPLTGRELLGEVLRHVDGVIFADPRTGLYVMRLARDDYDVNALELFDNSNILPETFEFSRISWEDTKNTTIVNYLDRGANFTSQPVQYQDAANVFVRKGVIDAETIDFLSFSNKINAMKAAARANKVRASPLARCSFSVDRTAYSTLPGDVIKVHKPDYGIVQPLIMRVIDVDYGTLDDPRIQIVCTEDIFAINAYAYGPPQDTGWVPVYLPASPLRMYRVVEVPFEMNNGESRRLMALGVRNDFVTEGFELWLDDTNTGTQYRFTGMARATVAGGVLRSTAVHHHNGSTSIIVENVTDPQLLRTVTEEERNRGAALIMVNNEIMSYTGISVSDVDGAVTVTGLRRGLFDTIQVYHAQGSEVFFFNDSIPLVDSLPLAKNGPVKVKLVPFTARESLTLADVPEITVNVNSRAFRPNPVGIVYINDVDPQVSLPGGIMIAPPYGVARVTWEWRNKRHQGEMVHELTTGLPRETGGGVRVTAQQGTTTLVIPYTERMPVYFQFPQDGPVAVTVEAIDFDGQLASIPRTIYTDYATAGGSSAMWQDAPPPDTTPAIDIEPNELGQLILDCTNDDYIVHLTRNVTQVVFLNPSPTDVLMLEIRQKNNYTISWPPHVNFISGVPYVVTPIPGAINVVGLITFDEGLQWHLRAGKPGEGENGEGAMVLTLDQENVSASATGTAGNNVTATSPAVTGTQVNGNEPVQFQWSRTDANGGPDFVLSNASSNSTTFSHTSSQSSSVTQTWTLSAIDATNRTAQRSVQVALSTTNVVVGFSAVCVPANAYGGATYPYEPSVTVTVAVSGGSGNFSYEWYKVYSDGPGMGIVGSTTSPSVTISRPNMNQNVTRTGQFGVNVRDNNTGSVVTAFVDVELETFRSGGGGTQPL